MSFAEFEASIARDPAPPPGLRMALQGLWHDARGDWDRAHRCVQDDAGGPGAWVHGYLHRKEGDTGNAGYWYARARQAPPDEVTFDEEWKQIARALTEA